jgi:hypothetical protein
MRVQFYRRDFSEYAVQPGVSLEVIRYSQHAVGGPKSSLIRATGKAEHLFELVNHLREPLEIINPNGDCVWWGYLEEVKINTKLGAYGVSLDKMSNKIAVAWTEDRIRHTTDWSGDADSIAEYGYKELLVPKADIVEGDALQTRDVLLENTRYPIPIITLGQGEEEEALLVGKGWLDTLQWQYYENLSGKEAYTDTGRGGREIGEDDRPVMAQSFQIASSEAWTATSIWLRIWYQGDSAPPTDSVVVQLKSDDAGEPGTTLATGTVAATEMSGSAEWYEFVLNTGVSLSPATTYWIYVARSTHPTIDLDAYYMIDTNIDAGYPRGVLYLYNTNLSVWSEDIYRFWGDMLFMVVGDQETTAQIAILLSKCGQFFQGTITEDSSDLDSNPYRDGDTAGGYELEKLLLAGTSNNRRLLCEVTRNRYLRIYEEPQKPSERTNSYAMNKEGQLLTSSLTPIDLTLCPVGIWCHLHDVVPPTVDLSLIADPTLFFIEEASYEVRDAKYKIVSTRDQSEVLKIGGVIPG